MRPTAGGRRRYFAGVFVTVAVVLAGALIPAGAGATDSDLKHSFAFKVKASHGYSIVAVAASQRADGRGDLLLIVFRKHSSVLYGAPAQLTATSIEADLGALGEVALQVAPSGRERTLHRRCGEEPETIRFEPQSFRGRFEFHGEEGFAAVSTESPSEYTRFFYDIGCGGVVQGESGGAMLPGARLRLHARRGPFRLNLQANKNRPGARTRFEVETDEESNGISIVRNRELWVGANAFRFDPLLQTASLQPPAPFSGQASFHRGAAPSSRWTGNLTVDMPGRANLPLTGAAVGATLVPGCWHQGEGGFRC